MENKSSCSQPPFLVDAEEVEDSVQLELIEMQCDDSLKSQHQLLSLPDFYQSLDNAKFPLMRCHAKRMMSLFGSTYICEQTFSLLNQNKSRLRSRWLIAISMKSFVPQPSNFLLTSQPSFNPKDSITAPTESNVLHIIGELEILALCHLLCVARAFAYFSVFGPHLKPVDTPRLGVMEDQDALIVAFSSSALFHLMSLIFLLTMPHRSSKTFMSGQFADQSSTVIPWSLN